ncbi:hypothetical protein HY386_01040 [Candidatus Daviesbacteria bacterium]|nr:hypothetical protein [Candidatus Daviesbacteria bacterium]
MIENFDLFRPLPFLDTTRQLARQATGRVGLEAMVWYPDPPTYQFVNMLEEAAKRQVQAQAKIDYYSLMTTDFHNNLFPMPQLRRERGRKTQEMVQRMRKAGVSVDLLNPPSLLQRLIPQLGRNHRKIGLIDGVGFVMGFNLSKYNFDCEDIAVALTEPQAVKRLAEVFEEAGLVERDDREIYCGGNTYLLVDYGRVGQSLILDRAVEMVRGARDYVRWVNLFPPNGRLEVEMARASKRGVDVEGIITRPVWVRKARWDIRLMQLVNSLQSYSLGNQLALGYHNPDIHAKVLVTDNQTLVGSHNLVWEGVWAGTEELDIFSTNPILERKLNRYYAQLKLGSRAA